MAFETITVFFAILVSFPIPKDQTPSSLTWILGAHGRRVWKSPGPLNPGLAPTPRRDAGCAVIPACESFPARPLPRWRRRSGGPGATAGQRRPGLLCIAIPKGPPGQGNSRYMKGAGVLRRVRLIP